MYPVIVNDDVLHHVMIPATSLGPLTPVMLTEYDVYRDAETDVLTLNRITYQATVESLEYAWHAPSEVMVRFIDGPPAWLARDAMVPILMGPRTKYGMF